MLLHLKQEMRPQLSQFWFPPKHWQLCRYLFFLNDALIYRLWIYPKLPAEQFVLTKELLGTDVNSRSSFSYGGFLYFVDAYSRKESKDQEAPKTFWNQ